MRILIFSNDSDSNYEDHCANNYPDEFSEEDDGVSSVKQNLNWKRTYTDQLLTLGTSNLQ